MVGNPEMIAHLSIAHMVDNPEMGKFKFTNHQDYTPSPLVRIWILPSLLNALFTLILDH